MEAHPPEIGPDIVIPGFSVIWFDEPDYAAYTAWIQMKILLGQTEEVPGFLQPMLLVAEKYHLYHRVIELNLMLAQIHYAQG